MFIYATEVNVVLARRLWPRSLSGRALGEPDARAIDLTLRRERLLSQDQLTAHGLTAEEAAAVAAGHLESPDAAP